MARGNQRDQAREKAAKANKVLLLTNGSNILVIKWKNGSISGFFISPNLRKNILAINAIHRSELKANCLS